MDSITILRMIIVSCCAILLMVGLYVITTPIHEAIHWVIDDIDPAMTPVEMHLFDSYALSRGWYGCVGSRETGGAPMMDATTNESITYGLQLTLCFTITYYIISRSYRTIRKKNRMRDIFTRQLTAVPVSTKPYLKLQRSNKQQVIRYVR